MAFLGSSSTTFHSPNRYLLKRKSSENRYQRQSKVRRASLTVREDPDFVSGAHLDEEENEDSGTESATLQDARSSGEGLLDRFGRNLHENGGDSASIDGSLSQEAAALESFECPLCSLALSNGDDLEQHITVHAGERESFECGACGKVFYEAATFGKHLRQHTGERPFRCDTCGKSFREKCSLTRHKRTHTGEKPFTCEVCDKSFADVGSYGRHKKTHMGNRAKVHQCPHPNCPKSFIDKSSLKRHVKTHSGERPYQCQVCMKSFTESGSFKRHQRVHTGEKRFRCKGCGRAFTEKASMMRHQRNVCALAVDDLDPEAEGLDEDDSPYSLEDFFKSVMKKEASRPADPDMCFECGDAISDDDSDSDSSSNDSSHGGNDERKPRRCRMCRKEAAGFTNEESSPAVSEDSSTTPQSGLGRTCQHCGKSFQDSSKLRRHIKIHTGVRDFKCTTCGKAFIEACSLRRHESVHSDVKPHTCKCGKGFTDSSGLKKHQLKCNGQIKEADISNVVEMVVNKISERSSEMEKDSTETIKVEPLLRGLSHSAGLPGRLNSIHTANRNAVKPQMPVAFPEAYMHGYRSNMLYICTECGQSCEDARGLRRHFMSHVQRGSVNGIHTVGGITSPVSCPTCGKMFISVQYLEQHMKNHETGAALGTSTQSSSKVAPATSSHSVSAASESVAQGSADFNPESSSVRPDLNQSASANQDPYASSSPSWESASGNSVTSCDVCGKTFSDVSSLKRHARLHTEQHQHACERCSKVFWDQGSLKRHRQRGCKPGMSGDDVKVEPEVKADPAGDAKFLCTQCKKVFPTKEDLTLHEKAHRVTPDLRCAVCRKSFPDPASLRRHARMHSSSRPYACDVCHKGFADNGSLAKHRARGCYPLSAATLDAEKLPCVDCGKVFSDQANFDLHVSTHRGIKPFSCSQCGKSFTEACSLKRHTRLHTGQNLCRCLHCGRTFLENSGLKKHLERRSCQQEKKVAKSWLFPCTACPKVFTKRYILMRHMKTHLGLRPFTCDKCDKSFTESSSLKRHYRQHTGERPYLCGGCGKTFTDAGVLKKHKHRCPFVVDSDDGDLSSIYSPLPDSSQALVDSPSNAGSDMSSSHVTRSPTAAGADSASKLHHNQHNSPTQQRQRLRFPKGCWRCGKRFSQPGEPEQHKKSAHSGVWPFKCLRCWRRFTRLPYLRVHKSCHH
ncbi:hypothetical protein BaRGS_00021427, partial [Batillaria attramentaria]